MPRLPAKLHSTSRPARALLVARPALDESDLDVRASLSELEQLLAGLGTVVVDTVIQRGTAFTATSVLGAGKVEEIKDRLAAVEDDPELVEPVLVFDGSLTPGQQRSLENTLEIAVTDRTGVILRVFEQRAQTDIARVEVELARLAYEAPRVREDRSLVDREGGGGGRGERGHTNVELRKQQIRARASRLRGALDKLRGMQALRRERREDVPRVALVGYTNAGKSSLMRGLTHGEVGIEDRLFATLGTTIRALTPETSPRVLVSDTVGFIRNLPHELLASFHSTLEEVRVADLLLHVVDAADPNWRAHLEVTRTTLAEIGAGDVPSRVVFNKIDRVDPETRSALADVLPDALQLSAHDPSDVRRLRDAIVAFFDERWSEETLVVPIGEGRLIAEVRGTARVLDERYSQSHARLRVRAPSDALARWANALAELGRIESVDDLLEVAHLHDLELEADGADFDASGLDFLVAHARDREGTRWIVRTPRRPDVSVSARSEARVLRLVEPRLSVAVPSWHVHAHDIIAYPRLPGMPVVTVSQATGVSWNVIDPKQPGEAFLESLARALASLQSITLDEVRHAGVPITTIDEAREELARAADASRSLLEPSESTWARWQRWLEDDAAWPTALALVHGDLHPGHMLVDDGGRLIGILDWTEAKVTDPSVDFAMVHGCFGAEATAELVRRFERSGGRTWPGLLEHAAERWAIFPAIAGDWAQRTGNETALANARAQLMALETESD